MTYDPEDVIQDDLSDVDENAGNFVPAPAGEYLARCVDVSTDKQTQEGYQKWGLRWDIVARKTPDGKLATADPEKRWTGKWVWDNMIHSPGARKRRKLLLSRLGVDCSRPISLTPGTVLGRWAIITITINEYSKDGKQRKNNKITFDGYERVEMKTVEAFTKAGKGPKIMSERSEKEQGTDFAFGAGA